MGVVRVPRQFCRGCPVGTTIAVLLALGAADVARAGNVVFAEGVEQRKVSSSMAHDSLGAVPVGAEMSSAPAAAKTTRGLSRYLDAIDERWGAQSVHADIIKADTVRPSLLGVDSHQRLAALYGLKGRVHDAVGLAVTTDYTVLLQRASYSKNAQQTASSDVFRILGSWLAIGEASRTSGRLVWKIERRNALWGNTTPRDLGFATGSALSSANFKALDWGITDLYWRQGFNGGRQVFHIGHMDPGDWADQFPLLNAWTAFLSDGFYNNPTEAIPKRGFGVVGQAFLSETVYAAAGVHDANGGDGDLDFASFWDTREWFSWVEVGRRGSAAIADRHNLHLHIWHQDRRADLGTGESRGFAYTHSYGTASGAVLFLRAGYSSGDAPQMRRFLGLGGGFRPNGRDTLGWRWAGARRLSEVCVISSTPKCTTGFK